MNTAPPTPTPHPIEDDNRSEVDESGNSNFKLVHVLENLFVLGLTSLQNWEIGLAYMKTHDDVKSNPLLLQLWYTLNQLCATFSSHVYLHADPSCEKLPEFINEEKTFDEIVNILKPLLNKKAFKDKVYSSEIVQKVLNVFKNSPLMDRTEPKENKNETKTTKRKGKAVQKKSKKTRRVSVSSSSSAASNSDSHSSSSSESESDSESQSGNSFEKLFSKIKKKNVVIKQIMQYSTGDTKRKLTTPGEVGTHLVKIEITDTKDLRKCSSERVYWQEVNKKGYFLLNVKENEEDKRLHKELDGILVKIGSRISKIKNVKQDELVVDRKK